MKTASLAALALCLSACGGGVRVSDLWTPGLDGDPQCTAPDYSASSSEDGWPSDHEPRAGAYVYCRWSCVPVEGVGDREVNLIWDEDPATGRWYMTDDDLEPCH